MNDLHNNIDAVRGWAAKAASGGAAAGKIIDRQGYGGVEFVISYGAVTATNATATILIKEGDVTGTLTSVADADLLGTELLASLPVADVTGTRTSGVTQLVTKRVGYKGNKRYVQCSLASETVTAATVIAIIPILHSPGLAPVANP
jgi:predicted secreted Zn-dependent protease